MRTLILGDMHHKANDYHINYQMKFLGGIKHLIKQREIDSLVFLGDIHDKRRLADIRVINLFRDMYSDISSMVKNVYIIAGNHDMYFSVKNTPNSIKSFFIADNVSIIDETPLKFGKYHFIPWINENNVDVIREFVGNNNREGNYLFGHPELNGFMMNAKECSESQLYYPTYDKYDTFFAGHFHGKQQDGNVLYTGTPYEMNFGEMGVKGIHILDSDTGEITFLENKNNIFKKLYFPNNMTYEEIDKKVLDISNKIITIDIDSNDESYINNIEMRVSFQNPHKVITTTKQIELDEDESEIVTDTEDELEGSFLSSINYDSRKEEEKFKQFFNIYNERSKHE